MSKNVPPNFINFHNNFAAGKYVKFPAKPIKYLHPRLKYVAALPWKFNRYSIGERIFEIG